MSNNIKKGLVILSLILVMASGFARVSNNVDKAPAKQTATHQR